MCMCMGICEYIPCVEIPEEVKRRALNGVMCGWEQCDMDGGNKVQVPCKSSACL